MMALVLTFFTCNLAGSGQDAVWRTLIDAAGKAQSQGQWSQAEQQLQSALKDARAPGADGVQLRMTLRALALLYMKEGKLSQAEPLFAELISLEDKSRDGQADLIADLGALGSLRCQLGNYAQAESVLKRVIAFLDKNADHNTAGLSNAMTNLAAVYEDCGKYNDAEALLKQSVALAENSTEGSALLPDNLESLGEFYRRQSKFAEAEPLIKRSLEINERVLGAGNPVLARNLTNLGKVYCDSGRADEAETALKRALALNERSFGADSIEASNSLVDLGEFYQSLDRSADAIAVLKKAVAMQEIKLGNSNPKLASAISKLARVVLDADRYEESELLSRRAMAIDKDAFGADSLEYAEDLGQLARVYLQQGKYQPAETLYSNALTIISKSCGPDHPDTATALNNVALLYVNQGKYAEAEPLVQRALKIRQAALDSKNPAIARNLSILASLAEARGDWAAAESLLKQALEIDVAVFPASHPDVQMNLRELALVCEDQGKWKDVEACYSRVLAADEGQFGKQDSRVVADLEVLTRALKLQGKEEQAKPIADRAMYLKEKLPGALLEPIGVSVTDNGANPFANRPIKDKWALVVGISNFKDDSINLKYAAKDATDFRNYLVNEAHFKPDHVKLLTDQAATREGITSNLGDRWLGRLANPDDLVVIYVSSHGSATEQDTGITNYIVPYDGNIKNIILNGIALRGLTDGLSNTIRSGRIVLVMDVCHGGGIVEGSKDLRRGSLVDTRQVQPGSGQIVLTSSQADQVSWESRNYPNSVFTRRLLEGLRKDKSNAKLTEAFQYTRDKVEEEVLRDRAEVQTPLLITKWWKGDDLSLSITPAAPRPGLTVNEPAVSTRGLDIANKSKPGAKGKSSPSVPKK